MKHVAFFLSVLVVLTFSACEKSTVVEREEKEAAIDLKKMRDLNEEGLEDLRNQNSDNPDFKPFYVYADKGSRDNHFTPSGFMPNGKCLTMDDSWTENCAAGKTCIKIVYDVECSRKDQKWAGIYWLNPPNNWGQRKGGFDLTNAKQVSFWARGEQGGEHIDEFTIGGISGNYPDSSTSVLGPVFLTTEWKQYTVDLRGKDMSYLSGGFSWSTNEEVNPNGCTFYLDEIRYE